MQDELQSGRASYGRREWAEAYRAYSACDAASPLGAADLERYGTAAYLLGREDEFLRILERAHQAHLTAGDTAPAARCAFWLAITSMLRHEPARASGWVTRGSRLVAGGGYVEEGFFLTLRTEEQLASGAYGDAYETAATAVQMADTYRDRDLFACARHQQGRALILQSRLAEGMALLDETMIAAIGGELSPIMTGLLYCSVIEACQQVFELNRAGEWTTALSRWCDEQPALVAFTDSCLIHRAEIMQYHGAWTSAYAEARRACERRMRDDRPNPPAAAIYRQAEIHRLRGEFDDAEAAYREASRLGRDPQPGLSLLRLAQGRTDAAAAAIRRVLTTVSNPRRRARLLPAFVEIMIGAGAIEEARTGAEELQEMADRVGSTALRAMAAQACGTVAAHEADCQLALESLRRAFELWQELGVPYEAARVRVLMGTVCRALGDDETASLEVDAARSVFEELGAAPDLARLNLLPRPDDAPPDGLTTRELEVLRLVADGKTNKEIAEVLFLSERTVDRHVSNLLTKLDVPTRAAATAYAYRRHLL